MDEVVKLRPNLTDVPDQPFGRPSRAEAEAAVRPLIAWAGDDPSREGLRDTPRRVARACEELFSGYRGDPQKPLNRVFLEASGYQELVLARDIASKSHCEHQRAPIFGKAQIGYYPRGGVVTIQFSGVLRDDRNEQTRFFNLLRGAH